MENNVVCLCAFFLFFYMFDRLAYIGPFAPIHFSFGRTNHTNLTRRIDPRHPDPPNSPISPKRAVSFFRFLGFGAEGSVFWASGEGGGPFSGFQEGGGAFSGFQGRSGGTFQPRLGAGGELGNALAAPGGMHRGAFHYPLFKET